MRSGKPEIVIIALFVFLSLSLLLPAVVSPKSRVIPTPRASRPGRKFDQATEKAGDFVAGFCSAAPLPLAALGLVVVLRRSKKD